MAIFEILTCNVNCRMRPKKIAYLSCRVCTTAYQMAINKLSKEVDVYCAWIDEAEMRNKQGRNSEGFGFEDEEDENAEEFSSASASNFRPSLR